MKEGKRGVAYSFEHLCRASSRLPIIRGTTFDAAIEADLNLQRSNHLQVYVQDTIDDESISNRLSDAP